LGVVVTFEGQRKLLLKTS